MKTGMTLGNFSRSGETPLKLISLTRGLDRTEHESLSILVGILSGLPDLEVFISFISDCTSSSFIGAEKNEFTIEALDLIFTLMRDLTAS